MYRIDISFMVTKTPGMFNWFTKEMSVLSWYRLDMWCWLFGLSKAIYSVPYFLFRATIVRLRAHIRGGGHSLCDTKHWTNNWFFTYNPQLAFQWMYASCRRCGHTQINVCHVNWNLINYFVVTQTKQNINSLNHMYSIEPSPKSIFWLNWTLKTEIQIGIFVDDKHLYSSLHNIHWLLPWSLIISYPMGVDVFLSDRICS